MTRGGTFRGKRRSGGKFRGRRRGGRFRGRRRGGGQRGGKAKKFKSVIHQLKRMKAPQRIQAMKMANDKFIRHMSNEVRKLRYKPLPTPVRNQMKRNARNIRKFISRKTSVRAKRRMLTQRGGFIGPLIAGLGATLLGPLVGSLFNRG